MIYKIELVPNYRDVLAEGYIEAENKQEALWKAAEALDSPSYPKDSWREDTEYDQLSLLYDVEDEDGEIIENQLIATEIVLGAFEVN